eukprot:3595095-Amphidinium_carterae.1
MRSIFMRSTPRYPLRTVGATQTSHQSRYDGSTQTRETISTRSIGVGWWYARSELRTWILQQRSYSQALRLRRCFAYGDAQVPPFNCHFKGLEQTGQAT